MLTSVQNVCVVTTFYTLESMKSILLPKFVFFRSRLRLSLKNTNLLFYWFICFLWGVALRIITYPAPSRREPLNVTVHFVCYRAVTAGVRLREEQFSLRLGHARVLTTAQGCHSLPSRRFATSPKA